MMRQEKNLEEKLQIKKLVEQEEVYNEQKDDLIDDLVQTQVNLNLIKQKKRLLE